MTIGEKLKILRDKNANSWRRLSEITRLSKTPLNEPEICTGDELDAMFQLCPQCKSVVYKKDAEQVFNSCPNCGNYFRLTTRERIEIICDEGSFVEFSYYDEKHMKYAQDFEMEEAVVTGTCEIGGYRTVICIMDSSFIGSSIGQIVGEKITFAIENAMKNKLPIIIFTASDGARITDDVNSLMQIAKVCGALGKLSEAGVLYITVLTHPTTGVVATGFAMLADIILAEKGASVGFIGQRAFVQTTIPQKLPDGFHTAESLLKHGFVDSVVERKNLKDTLTTILKIHIGNNKLL